CEILMATHAVKSFIRNRDFFKMSAAVETGADHDMWSFQRYAKWLDSRTQWYMADQNPEPPDSETSDTMPYAAPPPLPVTPKANRPAAGLKPAEPSKTGGRLEIEEVEGGLEDILKKLK
ncbi:MAG TPA: hypothetical protein VH251_00690, partial [Verrucomicrobiae bacterium]|nr:hypothetical protein [Verrucomicrobiae bacterium]